MTQYCLGCHGAQSSNRQGAPPDVTLDSMDNILNHLDTIRDEVRSETMPPSGGVTEESIELVVKWLDCEVINDDVAVFHYPVQQKPFPCIEP